MTNIQANCGLPEQPHDDQNEDDDQQDMNEIAGLRNSWNSCGPEVPQKPKDHEDYDEKFEHERFLSVVSARLTSVQLFGVRILLARRHRRLMSPNRGGTIHWTSYEVHPVSQRAFATERWWLDELFDEHTAVGLDDALRGDVVWDGRDLHVAKALSPCFVEYFAQGKLGIATPSLPRHNGVADVAKTVRRERFGPMLPPQSDRTTKLTVPEPPAIPRQPRNGRAVWKCDGPAYGVLVHEACQEDVRVRGDLLEFLLRHDLPSLVIRRPSSLEGCHVTGQILQ